MSFRESELTKTHAQAREMSSATDSTTDSIGPRQALVVALTNAVRDGAATGDIEVARVALEALNKLLAAAATDPGAVVDLATRRAGKVDA